MKKQWICGLLGALLCLSLAACGSAAPASPAPTPELTAEASAPAEAAPTPEATEAPTPTPAPTPAPISYEDAYLQYLAVYASLSDEVQRRVEMHNAVLKNQYPDSYYMHSDYLMQDYIPFLPAYPALGSALRDGDLGAAEASLRQRWPDAELKTFGEGIYEATYTYVDRTSGEEVERAGRCTWECNGENGALRVRAWVDEEMVEFTEFIPQGNDTWLLYTMADKVLVTYRDGSVTALWQAHRINQPAMSQFAGDVRFCSLEEKDFYPRETAEREWITGDPDAEYILTLEAGEMTYTGKVPQDIVNEHGDKIGVTWMDIDPIHLQK